MRQIKLHHSAGIALAILCAWATPAAFAAVPTTSAIEGVLLSSGGGPAADGNYTITVGIYGAETGGSAVWTESGVTIAAKGGQFSYQVGSKTPLSAAALNLPKAWIGIQIGTDPELPRKPLGASPFALRAAVAEDLECTGCLKAGDLDPGILQPYAKAADLGAYAKTADLSAYAKASDLGAYAKTSDLSSYAKAADLADYVKATSLAKVAGTGSYNDLKDVPTLAKVATSGSYADLSNQPKLPQLGAACGTDLVMKGIKADGSYDCVAAGIAADMINEVSNDLIWNQFVDKTDGTKDVQIKDGFSAGVTDTLNFPDIGTVQKIWIDFSAGNSDVSKLTVELFAPGMSTPYILYKGSKTGTTLVAKYNDTDKLDTGDMNKDWLGKNIKGNWSITVKDTAAISVPPGTPPFVYDGKFNWSVNIQTLSSKKIQIKGNLIVDGRVQGAGICGNGLLERAEGCDDGNNADGDGCSAWCDVKDPEKTCAAILAKNSGAKTGTYTIDLDAAGPMPARTVLCDMTTDGGGWTRFIRHTDPDGYTGISVDDWNNGIALAASGGIKQWLIKTFLTPAESTEANSKYHNGWVLNVNGNYQAKGFTFFRHTPKLSYDSHRYNDASRIDSAKLLSGSNCTQFHPSYNNGAYLWGEHRWSGNHSLGWMWMSHCASPSYHILIVNHDHDNGASWGRQQTLVGTNQSPGGNQSNYDEDGSAFEFFFR